MFEFMIILEGTMDICVVTGGSNGIGAAIVEKFLEAESKVYNLDINETPNAAFVKCDVSSLDSVAHAFSHIAREAGKIDKLVISAGIHLSGSIENTTESDFDNVFETNVKGAFLTLKHALPLMKKSGGSIVLLSSDQAIIGKSNSFAYNASKAAIAAMCRTTAIDYAEYNIRCNSVCPGTIDTPLYRKALGQAAKKKGVSFDALHKEENEQQLLNRIGMASEVADLIYFLCSDKANFITGSLHAIDGGYTAV